MSHLIYFYKQIHHFSGKKLYLNLVAMIFISLLEGIGILLLIPMLSISGLVDLDAGGIPLQVAKLFEVFQGIPSTLGLPIILSIYVSIVIGHHLLERQIMIKNAEIQQSFFRHLRTETYYSLLHANWDFYLNKRKSDLINIMTAEITRSGQGAYSFIQFISALLFTVIQIGLAFWLSPQITIFVLISGLFLILFNRNFLKRSLALGKMNYKLGKEYLGGITDQINGIKDIKSNTLESSRMDWFQSITKRMEDRQVQYVKLKSTSQLYYKVASGILIAFFIFFAISLFHTQGSQLMLVIVIFSRLWPMVAGIQSSLEQISTTIPSFKAVRALQSESKQAVEFKKEAIHAFEDVRPRKEITCKAISFRYKDDLQYALENVSVTIPVNQMTAFVGRSGAGKSTLIDIIMGLNKPEKGNILIDGQPFTSGKLLSFRQAISYVPQDPFLFNASIRENLQLVYPNASEEEMWDALAFSSASEFVEELPEGLDSFIGDRGIKLSGGERQRLVLARAILRKPSILVLDEATSSLDVENEMKIQEALASLRGKMTVIVIAHRLSTIRSADQVVVLDEGKVVQKGGFIKLAQEKRSVFDQLLKNQMKVPL